MSEDRIVLDRTNLERLIRAAREGATRAFEAGLASAGSTARRRDIALMMEGADVVFRGLEEAAQTMPYGVLIPRSSASQHIPYLDN